MQCAAPPSGIPAVPALDRHGHVCEPRYPSGARQLRHALARCGEAKAGRTATLPSALHTDVLVEAEPSGTLVRSARRDGTKARQAT